MLARFRLDQDDAVLDREGLEFDGEAGLGGWPGGADLCLDGGLALAAVLHAVSDESSLLLVMVMVRSMPCGLARIGHCLTDDPPSRRSENRGKGQTAC